MKNTLGSCLPFPTAASQLFKGLSSIYRASLFKGFHALDLKRSPPPTPPPQTPTPIPPFFFFCLPLRGLQWRREYQCLLKAKRMEVITAAEITVITVTASSSPRVSSCCRFQMRAEACVNICTSVCMWEKQPTAAG